MILALILLIGFFIIALIFRKISEQNLCAVCASVTLTWLTLLFFHYIYGGIDHAVLGILMGGSAVGLTYYFFEKKSDIYQIFKFPFLVSLFWISYQIIGKISIDLLKELIIIALIWILFLTVFLFYKSGHIREIGKKIIECCRNW